MRIVALGRTRTLYDAIREVVDRGHEVELILTSEPAPEYEVGPDDFSELATAVEADFECDPDLSEHVERFEKCDVAISVNWNTILSEDVLACFEHGVLNAHAGDLPQYRGNAAPNWAIINGEDEVVVTVHRMVPELDAGPILAKRSFPLKDRTSIGDVYEFLYDAVPEMFGETVDGLESGTVEETPQPDAPGKVLRCYPRKPEDSRLKWSESADHLDRIVRASSEPFFGAYTFFNGEKLRIWRAHPEQPSFEFLGTPGQVAQRRLNAGEVAVVTGDGFLVLEEVQLEGEARANATDVIESNRDRLGVSVDDLRNP